MYRKNNLWVMVLAVTVILCGLSMTGFANSTMSNENPSMTSGSQQPAPENAAVQSSEENLTNARQSFLQKNYNAAAQDIRKTVAFMKTQEENASASGKKMLTSSINELDKIADGLEKGTVTSVNALDNAFARAKEAISSNSQMKTAESKTGQAWQSTSSGVKNGLSWTGDKLKAGFIAVAKGTGWVVGKAVEGTGWVSSKTGSMINSAGTKVQSFGKNIQPQKQQTMTQ